VQSAGAGVILMASRALAAAARGPRDYLDVYGAAEAGKASRFHPALARRAFDPALPATGARRLRGGRGDLLELIDQAGDKVNGIKLSVLDASKEVALRRRLPAGSGSTPGDDFATPDLIKALTSATGPDHSARCSARSPRSPPRPPRRCTLDAGDLAGYEPRSPTVPLSRLIFEEPTLLLQAGVAFLAWLNGLQRAFDVDGLRQAAAAPPDPGLRAGRRRRGAHGPGPGGRR